MSPSRRKILELAAGSVAAGGLGLPTIGPAIGQGISGVGGKPFKIYMITFRGQTDVEKGFQDYIQANRIPVEFIMRDVKQNVEANMPALIDEIRRIRPDLIYTWGTPVTLRTVGAYDAVDPDKHITDIPVVFANVSAPVLAKVVPSLQSSGRNVTGVFHIAPQEIQLKAMKSYLDYDAVGVLYNTAEQNSVVQVAELRGLAKTMKFDLQEFVFNRDANGKLTSEGAPEIIRSMKDKGVDWLFYLPDTFLGTVFNITSPAAVDVRLPTFASAETGIRTGGALAGLICRFYNVGQFAAFKAQQILTKKMAAKDVPIETLTRFSLIIRMNVAKQIKVYPPIGMLNFAEVLTS